MSLADIRTKKLCFVYCGERCDCEQGRGDLCIDCDGLGKYPSGQTCISCAGSGRVFLGDGEPIPAQFN